MGDRWARVILSYGESRILCKDYFSKGGCLTPDRLFLGGGRFYATTHAGVGSPQGYQYLFINRFINQKQKRTRRHINSHRLKQRIYSIHLKYMYMVIKPVAKQRGEGSRGPKSPSM